MPLFLELTNLEELDSFLLKIRTALTVHHSLNYKRWKIKSQNLVREFLMYL